MHSACVRYMKMDRKCENSGNALLQNMDKSERAVKVEQKFCDELADSLCLLEKDLTVKRSLKLSRGKPMEGQGHCGDKCQTHCVVEEEYTIAVPLVRPKPEFLSVLRLAGAKSDVFTWKEVLHYLKIYIISRQMFDASNPSIVHCKSDLLGDVFGLPQFTINDVLKLLAENCTPLPDTHLQRRRRLVSKPSINTPPTSLSTEDKAAYQTSSPVISSTSSVEPTIKHINIPHTKRRKSSSSGSSGGKFRRIENARSGSPPGPSKRSGESSSVMNDDRDGESYPWYFQLELGDRSDKEQSEVLSVQDKETVVVQDSTDDLWFLEEDSVTVEVPSDTEFSIEYDVESDISPGTESDLSSVRSGEGILVVCKESDVEFFADCSDTDNSDDDKELTEADNWCCAECKQWNPPVQRYCGRCWKLRADWLNSQCSQDEKSAMQPESKELNKEKHGASKVVGDKPVYNLIGKDDKLFSFDSGVGSLSSTLPSSQETVTSDISVFCNTPDIKSLPCLPDTGISLFTKEAHLVESRHSFSNIQLNQPSQNSVNLNDNSYATGTNKGDSAPKAPSTALDEPCMICLSRPKTASLIHGTTGHQVCCFSCGKRLRRRGKLCPVCRRPIQKVVRNYVL